MASAYQAVFFDAGHTLIESMPDVAGIYCRATERLGATIRPQHLGTVLATLSRTYDDTTRRVMKTAVTDQADREMWRAITRPVYEALPELHGLDYDAWFSELHDIFVDPGTWQPYEETVEVLEQLRDRGLRCAVISNWSSNLPHILEARGLARYFGAVVVSCIEGFRKPDPQLFDLALQRVGVEPQAALHVGDTYEDDIVGAAAAGIQGVLVDRGGRSERDCTVIRDLRGVLALLE